MLLTTIDRRGNKILLGICALNIVAFFLVKVYYVLRNKQKEKVWQQLSLVEQVAYVENTKDEGAKRLDFRFAHWEAIIFNDQKGDNEFRVFYLYSGSSTLFVSFHTYLDVKLSNDRFAKMVVRADFSSFVMKFTVIFWEITCALLAATLFPA
jgi:hypothetical protein